MPSSRSLLAILLTPILGAAVLATDAAGTGTANGGAPCAHSKPPSRGWKLIWRDDPADATTPFPNSFDAEYVSVYDHHD